MKVKDLVYRIVADWAEQMAGRNDVVVKTTYGGDTYIFSSSGYSYENLQRWVWFQLEDVIYDYTPLAEIKTSVDDVLDNVEFLTDEQAEDYYIEYGVEDYEIEVFGYTLSAINVLRDNDETAFREMYLDWLDTQEREAMELC